MDAAAPFAPPPRRKSDLVYGAVAVVALALALVFFVAGEADTGADGAAPPPITVIEPRSGAAVSGPFAFVFETPATMTRDSTGWIADGRYHLHATVSGVELMAGTDDIESIGGNRYRWSIPGLPPGEHRVRLQWSGPDHRTLRAGGSAPFTLLVQ